MIQLQSAKMKTTLKYKVIKTVRQYNKYCKILEQLISCKSRSRMIRDEIELLTTIIERSEVKPKKMQKSKLLETDYEQKTNNTRRSRNE